MRCNAKFGNPELDKVICYGYLMVERYYLQLGIDSWGEKERDFMRKN